MLSLAFSRDGSMLAGGTGFKGVDLWNVANPASPQQWGQTFYSGTDNINSMAFSKDGGILILAAGNNDGNVQLWNVTHRDSPRSSGRHCAGTTPVNSVVFSHDGRTLAIGSDNGTVGLWNVSNPASPRRLDNLSSPLSATSIQSRSAQIATCSRMARWSVR